MYNDGIAYCFVLRKNKALMDHLVYEKFVIFSWLSCSGYLNIVLTQTDLKLEILQITEIF